MTDVDGALGTVTDFEAALVCATLVWLQSGSQCVCFDTEITQIPVNSQIPD